MADAPFVNFIIGGTFFAVIDYFINTLFNLKNIKTNKQQVTLEFLNEFRDAEFKKSQNYIVTIISQKCINEGNEFTCKGYKFLDEQDNMHVRKISYYFDYVGAMAAANAIDKKLLLTVMSRQIINLWLIMRPLLYAERKMQKTNGISDIARYQSGFEHLYMLALDFSRQKITKYLKDSEMDHKPIVFDPKETNI